MGCTAFLYPGQGSQSVGMGKDLFDTYAIARKLYAQADAILGFEITKISFGGPEEILKQTQYTQPALFVHCMILSFLIQERGLKSEATAGHSLGEFSALACADVFDFATGLKLVQKRGQLMQQASENGSGIMAAIIGLESQSVIRICEKAKSAGVVQAANFNSPGQIVISGSRAGVKKAMELAKAEGAKRVLELPVSGAFHSSFMEKTAESFRSVLNEISFNNPSIPIYANVTAQRIPSANMIIDLLYQQLTHSVRWIETIQNMIHDGVTHFIEVGPGKVLTGLVKRINSDVEVKSIGTIDDVESL